jgi:hypothetical protein
VKWGIHVSLLGKRKFERLKDQEDTSKLGNLTWIFLSGRVMLLTLQHHIDKSKCISKSNWKTTYKYEDQCDGGQSLPVVHYGQGINTIIMNMNFTKSIVGLKVYII